MFSIVLLADVAIYFPAIFAFIYIIYRGLSPGDKVSLVIIM